MLLFTQVISITVDVNLEIKAEKNFKYLPIHFLKATVYY